MNTLYIIGNGFDLAHGLKTSYNDFLLWYLKDCAKKKIYSITFDDKLIKLEGFGHFQDIDHYKIDSIKEIKEFFSFNNIELIPKSTFVRNILYKQSVYNWVDIEAIYFSELLLISKVERIEDQKRELIKTLNIQLDFIKDKLEEYLNSLDETIIINREIQSHFSRDINRRTPNLVLNFNYTSAIDHYIRNSPNTQIINIHGKLCDPENPIIFGYGDEMHPEYESIERLNIDEFLVNFKSFGYLRNSNYSLLDNFINFGTYKVIILGHSCGLSDRVLLSTIFQHENCSNIEICYYKKSENINDHYEKTIRISRHFSGPMKGKMRSKIVAKDKSFPLCSPS